MKNFLAALFGYTILFSVSVSSAADAKPAKIYQIRFGLAHRQHNDWIIQSIENYGRSLEKASGGRLKLELIPIASRLEDRFREGAAKVLAGETEMSQVSLTALAQYNPNLQVMELPYLFRSHEHAASIMDGKVGEKLFAELLVKTDNQMRGLAYTYSGGQRAIMTHTKEIHRYEDLKDVLTFDLHYPIGKDILRTLQTKIHRPAPGATSDVFLPDDVEARETQRAYDVKAVSPGKSYVYNQTDHSLFMTAIIVNEKFFRSLPTDLRAIVKDHAQKMALEERVVSLEQKAAAIKLLQEKGGKVVVMKKSEQARMRKFLQPIYDKYMPQLGSYISAIQQTPDNSRVASF